MRFILFHYLVSRAIYFFPGLLILLLGEHPNVELFFPDPSLILERLQKLYVYADDGWYRNLATGGYDKLIPSPELYKTQFNWAFFPLLPILINLIPTWLEAGIAIFWGLSALYITYKTLIKFCDKQDAKFTIVLMCYFSYSQTLHLYRPELLMFLLWSITLYTFIDQKYYYAIICGFLSSLCKPNGFFICFLLFFLAWSINGSLKSTLSKGYLVMGSFLSPIIGLAVFCIYMNHLTGDYFAWAHVQKAWGSSFVLNLINQAGDLLGNPQIIGRWG
jgi:Gpi18-like mannosyltransferase